MERTKYLYVARAIVKKKNCLMCQHGADNYPNELSILAETNYLTVI
jgi:hypothetical protein